MRTRPALSALALAASVLAGCGVSDNATTGSAPSGAAAKTIAISFPNGTKQDAVLKEFEVAKATAAAEGYTIIIDDPGQDQQKQVNTIETWIQQGVGAIIAQPVAPETIASVASKARAAGIKWVTYANKVDEQDATLGFDHVAGGNAIGKQACEYAKTKLGGSAKAVLLTYEKGPWAQRRREGIEQGLASCGASIETVAKQDALSQTEGLNAMGSILQANPEVNLVLAVEETATEGAFQALTNAPSCSSPASTAPSGPSSSSSRARCTGPRRRSASPRWAGAWCCCPSASRRAPPATTPCRWSWSPRTRPPSSTSI
jgi:ribose transport system substrate-binding protein